MSHRNITASGSVTVAGTCAKLMVQINLALTGNIVVADANGTVATITNPTVGSKYEYWDLVGPVTVNPSTTTDITVNTGGASR